MKGACLLKGGNDNQRINEKERQMKISATKKNERSCLTPPGNRPVRSITTRQREQEKEFMKTMNDLIEKYGTLTDDDFFKVI
ncbi:hypothetical protein DBY68_003110 [Pseudocitrobacter sp. RIT415]|nr:hypothetical protein DBY68_003110 [Pseudocitrobacter sp. RIT 415]